MIQFLKQKNLVLTQHQPNKQRSKRIMNTLEQTKAKLQKMLIELNGGIKIDGDGDFVISGESARLFIRAIEFGPDDKKSIMIRFFCPLVMDVAVTPDLTMYVATEGGSYRFGHIRLILEEEKGNKTGSLYFEYTIFANDLDMSEVDNAIRMVLFTSADLDTELHKKFGGEMFGKDPE